MTTAEKPVVIQRGVESGVWSHSTRNLRGTPDRLALQQSCNASRWTASAAEVPPHLPGVPRAHTARDPGRGRLDRALDRFHHTVPEVARDYGVCSAADHR